MNKLLERIFGSRAKEEEAQPTAQAAEILHTDMLSMQSELQGLRMALAEREKQLAALQQDLDRQRERHQQIVQETAAAWSERLLSEVASPASQILTQAYLLEEQGRAIQARDVIAVTKRILRALERQGLTFEGQPGAQAAFDPNQHTPITVEAALQSGQPVTIRFAGVSYQGKMLHKAVVE